MCVEVLCDFFCECMCTTLHVLISIHVLRPRSSNCIQCEHHNQPLLKGEGVTFLAEKHFRSFYLKVHHSKSKLPQIVVKWLRRANVCKLLGGFFSHCL